METSKGCGSGTWIDEELMEVECSNRREYVDEHHRCHLALVLRPLLHITL